LFSKHVHPVMHDSLLHRAEEVGVTPREIQYVTTAEEAAYFWSKMKVIAFINRMVLWRVAHYGLDYAPLVEAGIEVKTTLITRSDDRTRLTSEFRRAAMKSCNRKSDFQSTVRFPCLSSAGDACLSLQ